MKQLDLFHDDAPAAETPPARAAKVTPKPAAMQKPKKRRPPIRYKTIGENILQLPTRRPWREPPMPDERRNLYFHTRLYRLFLLKAVADVMTYPFSQWPDRRAAWLVRFQDEFRKIGLGLDALDRQSANFQHLLENELRRRMISQAFGNGGGAA